MLQRGAALLRGDFDVAVTGCIDRVSVPPKRVRLFNRALHVVAQRTGPVNREPGAQLVPNIHRILDAKLGVLAHFRRFRRGTGGPYGVMKSLGSDHRALNAVVMQGLPDAAYDFPLGILADGFGRDHVRVMRGPIADAELCVIPDHLFEGDRGPRGRVEERLSLIGGRPLRAGNKVFAARFGTV